MFSKVSSDKQERKAREFLKKRLLNESAELTSEEIEEINREIEATAPVIAHLVNISAPKIKGLNHVANKLQRRQLDDLASLVLTIDDSKVTEKDITDLSIQVDLFLNQGAALSSIEDYISSFIGKINNREEEQRHQLEQTRQEKLVAQQELLMKEKQLQAQNQQLQAQNQQLQRLARERRELEAELAAFIKQGSSQDIEKNGSGDNSEPNMALEQPSVSKGNDKPILFSNGHIDENKNSSSSSSSTKRHSREEKEEEKKEDSPIKRNKNSRK